MKANYIRIFLLITIAIMFISLIGKLDKTFYNNKISKKTHNNYYYDNDLVNPDNHYDDLVNSSLDNRIKKNYFSKYKNNKNIIVNTEVFKNIKISLFNGAIISASLNDYSVSLKDKTPMNLLTNKSDSSYIAKSTIVLDKKPIDINFESKGIRKEKNKQILTLVGKANGLEVTRNYIFDDNKYNIEISQNIINLNTKPVNIIIDNSLTRDFNSKDDNFSFLNAHSYTFTGVAYSTVKDSFRKESFKEISKNNGNPIIVDNNGQGWVAFLQHYFVSAWIPQSTKSKIYYKNLNSNLFEAGIFTNIFIEPNKSENVSSILYTGPIIKDNLVNLAPNLEKTLDYGMLSFFSEIIFWIMDNIHSVAGNWGLTIILVTCLIKLIFYPLSAKSYRSMAKMRMLQPSIKRLQKTYKDDRAILGKKMMELYKEKNVNPLSGCLPMVIQIPIFISLYWVLLESVELRQANFIFWINDLSIKDQYFVLPILMGLSMFLQQKISPTPTDPIQGKIMMFLPIIFTFLFASFPSGLVLYWITNNLISILQQWIITKQYQKNNNNKKIIHG